jgi:hypothetical protein
MTTVCFTGAGKRHGTDTFTREEWEGLARQYGFVTLNKVTRFGCDILVASRSDTSKADAARIMGVRVMSYGEFEQYLEEVASEIGGTRRASMSETIYSPTGEALTYPSRRLASNYDAARATVAPTPTPRAASIQAGARGTYVVVFSNGARQGFNTYDEARRLYDRERRVGGSLASSRPPERHPITNVPSLRPYGSVTYECNNRTFSIRAAAESYRDSLIREEDRDAAMIAVDLATQRRAAGLCEPHGFRLEECNACRSNAAAEAAREAERAERRAAERRATLRAEAEAQRIEDAKLAPIGALKGRRRMNLEGDD